MFIHSLIRGLGSESLIVPVFAGTAIIGEFTKDTWAGSVASEWGGRSLRAFFVGAPAVFFLQHALGSPRPTEGNSDWCFLNDDNSVSGHSFYGAIPFLTAARMVENPCGKWSLYLASPLVGLTRINDDMHYFSQVLLGWWIAWLASASVDETETLKKGVSVMPVAARGGAGVLVTLKF